MSENITKEIQKKAYEILCDIDDFCKENDIKYYLSGGTCLGAVRHKGFIPWDDDIDIMMPRPDYDRFIELYSAQCDENYSVGSLATNEEWIRPFARVWRRDTILKNSVLTEPDMGVFVDLFPIDGVPKTKISRFFFYRKLWIIAFIKFETVRKYFKKGERLIWIKKLIGKTAKLIGPRRMMEYVDRCARRYKFEGSKYVAASMALGYYDKETIEYEKMSNPIYMRFEDRDFPLPCGYDTYLTNLYGDYMTIPKNKRSHLQGWDVSV